MVYEAFNSWLVQYFLFMPVCHVCLRLSHIDLYMFYISGI